MARDYDWAALKTELQDAKYNGTSDQQAADLLNSLSEPGPVPTKEVKLKMQKLMVWAPIADGSERHATDSVRQACRALIDSLESFDEFDLSDAEINTAVNTVLDGLVSATLLTADQKQSLLDLTLGRKSKAQTMLNVRTPVRDSDVKKAREL